MTVLHAIVLALVQGVTEFLPISSSAHLILVPVLFGWADQGLAFDVAVHLGALIAVLAYFRHDVAGLTHGSLRWLGGGGMNPEARLALWIALGTVPVGLAGLLLGGQIEAHLRDPVIIAVTTIVFALLMWWADTRRAGRSLDSMGWRDVLLIGLAQALALIPGTSRSGITMTAALAAGLSREAAARFSFLLSIPVILLASGLKGLELLGSPVAVDWTALLVGVVVSAVSAYVCIALFLNTITRLGFLPWVVYRLVLGGVLLVVFV